MHPKSRFLYKMGYCSYKGMYGKLGNVKQQYHRTTAITRSRITNTTNINQHQHGIATRVYKWSWPLPSPRNMDFEHPYCHCNGRCAHRTRLSSTLETCYLNPCRSLQVIKFPSICIFFLLLASYITRVKLLSGGTQIWIRLVDQRAL